MTVYRAKETRMKMEIKVITPQLAATWLNRANRDNRKIRLGWVSHLVEVIKRGEFKLSHQGIAFSKTGRLLDGQHRLMAIAEAEIPVTMVVTSDVDEDTFSTLDIGARRSFSDMYKADPLSAGVSRFFAPIIFDRYSPVQQNAIHKITDPLMRELRTFCNSNKKGISVASVHAAAVLRMLIDEDKEYIKLVYWNLIHTKHSELPPVGRLFVDQIYKSLTSTTGHKGTSDLFSRALKVFDKESANTKVLRVVDKSTSYELVRSVFAPLIEKKEKKPASKAPAPTRAKSEQLSHVKAA
jgi:hypothetical protein